MRHRPPAGLVAGLLVLGLSAAAPAAAAPVTVDLRIEGSTRTLFEGQVTTDVRPFRFTGSSQEHRCDGTATENQGPSPLPAPTRGAALAEASERAPFSIEGTFSASLGSPSFDTIAGEKVAFDPASNRFLAEYKNGQFASYGSCGDPIQAGDDVLFAYTDGSEPLLKLTGPRTTAPSAPVTVRVVDASTGAPVAGATVDGATTGADGTAPAGPFSERGNHALKASKPGTIRSNRLRVCVTNGVDGACGSADRVAPRGRVRGIRDHQRFARSRAPRELKGAVSADESGLRAVKLSLTRTREGRCTYYSPRAERFRRTRCGRRANFAIGNARDFRYLLPRRLGPGRYVLDVVAVDRAGNRDRRARGRSRVVFFVG